jgi:hypothetical protein
MTRLPDWIPDWNVKQWLGAVTAVAVVGVIVSGALSPAPVQDVTVTENGFPETGTECVVSVETPPSGPPVVVQTGSDAVVIQNRIARSVGVSPGTELRVRVVRYGDSTENHVTGIVTADCNLQEIDK